MQQALTVVFQKHKEKRAAELAARQAAEASRIAQAWREYLALCEQRLEVAQSFEGLSGAGASGCPIALKKNEKMFFSVVEGAVLVEPRRGAGQWQGANQGVSVRVPGTKSMRYRVGSSKGTYVQGAEAPTPIDEGSFTLTNQRAVFFGAKASREWQWSKLLGVTHFDDAPWTAIAVSNRQKTSGVAVDSENIDAVRFWIDLAVADANGTRAELVRELRDDLAEQRVIAQSADHDGELPAPG